MLLSTQTTVLIREFGYAEAIRRVARAGFDAFDLSMGSKMRDDDEDALNQDNYREYAQGLRRTADECGIFCNQAHAPFSEKFGLDAAYDQKLYDRIVRAMEIASIVGAKNIVVHPYKHLNGLDEQKQKEMNHRFFLILLPLCEKFGIHIAIENISSTYSAALLCDMIDKLNSPWIVACMDIGHAVFLGQHPVDMVHALGKERLKALHVHDNDGKKDLHTLPFLQSIGFEPFMRALADIGYTGEVTLEADKFLWNIPAPLLQDALHYMCKTGRYLISLAGQ